MDKDTEIEEQEFYQYKRPVSINIYIYIEKYIDLFLETMRKI